MKNPNMRWARSNQKKRIRLGPVAQKILLCLAAGITLSLTRRPDQYFRVISLAAKEWQKINRKSLHAAIRALYQSRMIDCRDNNDGTTAMVIADNGRVRVLRFNVDALRIKKPPRWDGFWRIIIFDIPETKKRERDALSSKFRQLGMFPIQKSVFVYPYDCKDEIAFVAETFGVTPYVRFILAKDIDVAPHLKHKFRLS